VFTGDPGRKQPSNAHQLRNSGSATFEKLTQPTALQAEALELAAHAPVITAR
jgi:hypothetical protein